VSELRGLLASFLGLFSVIVFLKRPDKISARYYLYQVGVLLLFGLSLLAKPSTAPLPAIALLIDYLISKRSLKRLAIEIAPMVLLSIVIIIVTTKAQPMDQISFFDRPRVIGDALAFYLFKFAGPFHLGIDYGRSPQLTLNNSITYFDWIIPAGALASAFFLRRKALWLLTAALISLASIAPVSGIVTFAFQGFSTVADRYVYLAMIGPALALTAILSSARFRSGYASKVAFAVIFLLGIISFAQCKVWKNTDTLMSQAISVDPNSSMALNYFATKLFDKGDYQSSLQKLKLAIQVYPGYPPAHFNAGVAEGAIGDQTDAINEYLTAIRLDSQHADPYINLGNIYADQGRFVDACTMYAQADKIDTKTSNLHFNWGVALAKSGYDYEAFYHFQKEIEYNPSFPKSYINAGYIDAKQNKMPEAAEMFAKAVSIDPTQPPWWTDLAVINDRLGKRDEAASDIQKALAIDPQFAPALSMQSKLLQEQSKR
jgi:tetratricopeptide (TPR) repeat protein